VAKSSVQMRDYLFSIVSHYREILKKFFRNKKKIKGRELED